MCLSFAINIRLSADRSTSEIYGKSDKVPFSEEDDRLLGSTHISRWGYSSSKAIDEFLRLLSIAKRDCRW